MDEIRKPCKSCPWRVDAHMKDIPGFSLELAEGLSRTCETAFGNPAMACHQSDEGKQFVCAGWLARYGQDSIIVRLILTGSITEDNVPDGTVLKGITPEAVFADLEDWPEMHATFEEMIVKLRAQSEEVGHA